MSKTTAKSNNTSANLGFEAKLWVAAALLPKLAPQLQPTSPRSSAILSIRDLRIYVTCV